MPNVKGAVAALAALSLVNPAILQNAKVVQSDTSSYSQSSPVYPSPEMSGIGGWDEALSKAQAMVSQMSLEEKVNITGGYGSKTTGCSGNVPAIDRVELPGMCVQDGPAGVRGAEGVSGYPAGVHVGARYVLTSLLDSVCTSADIYSWNKSHAYDRAYAMAGEFKRAGATVSLGPAVLGPLGRIARGNGIGRVSVRTRISVVYWGCSLWRGPRMVVWFHAPR